MLLSSVTDKLSSPKYGANCSLIASMAAFNSNACGWSLVPMLTLCCDSKIALLNWRWLICDSDNGAGVDALPTDGVEVDGVEADGVETDAELSGLVGMGHLLLS